MKPSSRRRAGPAPDERRPQFRAFWVDAFHPGIKSPQEVDALIRDMQASNVNAVLVQLRRRGDAYYNKTIEPRSAELRKTPNYDPLAYLIERAHAAVPRIEVHAWLATLPIATASALPTAPEHVCSRHGPNAVGEDMWLSVAADGTTAAENTLFLDPGHPAASQHIVDVVLNLVRYYAVDGIHLDLVRYPNAQFGYNPVSVARYLASTGATGTPAPTDPAWQGWRRDQVTGLVRQIYLETLALRPDVKVSAASIPWGGGPTGEVAWQRSNAMTGVFQDWLGWVREGILDMVIPMNYDREADVKQKAWFDQWIEWEKTQCANRHLVVGIGAFLNDVGDTLRQARRAQAPSASGQMAQGVVFYSYAATNRGNLPREELLRQLTATQATGEKPIFAVPASTPEMPWKTRPAAGYLKGRVRLASGRPSDGLTVEIGGPAPRLVTVSGTGFYGAAGLPPGCYTVAVVAGGLPLASAVTDVHVGQVATADIDVG
jgi:uncharacterized lipoprotein YddW (UPF0748 family)